ncbi:hypothetical protein JTB14_017494 [Gonioctena quinquepunctata]|nr:hypothetical protein JTB14_017494 [Gonioctena quinquepunctata]
MGKENDLLEYVHRMDSILYGLRRTESLQFVGEFAKKIGKEVFFPGNVAGKGWFPNFELRHPNLSLRKLEPTSLGRVKSFNKQVVERFHL